MTRQPYDHSSNWMLQHQGRSIAILGGLREVISCKSLQSGVVQPIQLPDGLLEVTIRGRAAPLLLLVEFRTYPESRNPEQLMDDIMLVVQAKKMVPEVLALVLCPKGNMVVPESHQVTSDLGWTTGAFSWKVQRLWELSAEVMMRVPDVGIVPWIPLMAFEGPPEPLLRRCRERIDQEGGDKRPNLLAVTQVLTRIRYPQQELLDLFGRSEAMIESPLIQEIVENANRKTRREDIEVAIQVRFGKLSDDARARLQGMKDETRLDALFRFAIICPSLDAFVERLVKETTPPPAPISSRRKRKS